MKKTALFLISAAFVALGCEGTIAGPPDDYAEDRIEDAVKADGPDRPVGTFRDDQATAGSFTLLVLKSDRTFYRETMVYCVMAPCYPVADEGTFSFSSSGDTRYIRFKDQLGNLVDRYAYRLEGDQLQLRQVYTSGWQHLGLANAAWCAAPADCGAQNLIHPMCVGSWSCTDNTCGYSCQTQANPCEAAGGECVGLNPDSCPDGIIGAAATYSCGGMLGVMCCLPQPANPCEAAGGECVGLNPSNCQDGVIGDATTHSCGGMVGVMCCLPPAACVPTCQGEGEEQGWYDSCDGRLLCATTCDESEPASCGAIGSRSEGWYTDGPGCYGNGLIAWAQCADELAD